MMSGEVSMARSIAERESSASATIEKSGSRAEDVGDAHPEQGVIVDDEDLRDVVGGAPVGTADVGARARCIPWLSCALLSSRRPVRSGSPDGRRYRPPAGSYVESRTDPARHARA
jgi:hypothetical protein